MPTLAVRVQHTRPQRVAPVGSQGKESRWPVCVDGMQAAGSATAFDLRNDPKPLASPKLSNDAFD